MSRPAQLDDRRWLSQRYQSVGDMAIALELGVSRKMVRLARERLGIRSLAPGRRRGPSGAPRTDSRLERTGQLIAARFEAENRAGGPAATEEMLAGRIVAAHEARVAGDENAYDDALLAIASAAGLVYEHRQKLRRAA